MTKSMLATPKCCLGKPWSLSAAFQREWKHNGNSLSGMKDGDHRWTTQGPPSWPGHAPSCIAMTECIFKTCTRWRRRMALHRLANLWLFVYGVMSRTNANVRSCRYCSQYCHDQGKPYSSFYPLSCWNAFPNIPSLLSSFPPLFFKDILVFMVYGVMSRTNASVCRASFTVRITTNTEHHILLILFPSALSPHIFLLSFLLILFSSFKDKPFVSPSSFHSLWGHEPNKCVHKSCLYPSQHYHEHGTRRWFSFLLHFLPITYLSLPSLLTPFSPPFFKDIPYVLST